MPVDYEVMIEPEDLDYHGNCMASGDEAMDREVEEWIKTELARGNECAWCSVTVKAIFEDYEGYDSLGGCSYSSRADLEKDLIPEMKRNALAALRVELHRVQTEVPKNARKAARAAKAALARLNAEEK